MFHMVGCAPQAVRKPRAKRERANPFHNYFLALTYDPVLENKKVNALTVSCSTWSDALRKR